MAPVVTIVIGNSTCKILDLPADHFKRLSNLMSYTLAADGAGYGGLKYRRKLLTARGEFPTGILYIAKAMLNKFKIPYKVLDNRVLPKSTLGMFKWV